MRTWTRLLLVRHGSARTEDEGGEAILVGWADVPLAPRGVAEARRAASRLAREAPGGPLYASPLRRALETARIVAGPGRGIVTRPDLREIGCGTLDGVALRRIAREHPDLWAANERQDDPDFRWPGGESYRDLRARALRSIGAIAEEHSGGVAVVVTHTGVITQLVGAIRGTNPARWSELRVHPGSVTELSWSRSEMRLVGLDDRSHLANLDQER